MIPAPKKISLSREGQVILRDHRQTRLEALVTVTANVTTSASISTPASTSTMTPPTGASAAIITSTSTFSSLAKDTVTCVASSSSSSKSSSNQSSKIFAVGASVGVPFAIALLTALVLLGRERRKARQLEQEVARLGAVGGYTEPGLVVYREPTTYYLQFNGEVVENAEFVGSGAEHELMA